MALANVSVLMAMMDYRVLIIDWDLEAPGLEVYFKESAKIEKDPKSTPGIVDILSSLGSEEEISWVDCVNPVRFGGSSLDLISAGMSTDDYRKRMQKLDWGRLFDRHNVGNYFERLRDEWRREYDFILIDSRTGITDIGDICTVLLPDALVLMFVSNSQNIDGVFNTMERAHRVRKRLPINRSRLLALPVPARDEIYTEYDKSQEWKAKFAKSLGYMYKDWLPKEVSPEDALNKVFIPYVTNWSFGERIPVLENKRELSDPSSIGAAYSRITTLLASRFDWYALEARSSTEEIRGTRLELDLVRSRSQAAQLELNKVKLESRASQRKSRIAIFSILGIVIGIIGILAAISIPAYNDYTVRAKVTEGLIAASEYKIRLHEYYNENSKWPPDSVTERWKKSSEMKNVGDISVVNGNIVVTYEFDNVNGDTIVFSPIDNGAEWNCKGGTLAKQHRPSSCQ